MCIKGREDPIKNTTSKEDKHTHSSHSIIFRNGLNFMAKVQSSLNKKNFTLAQKMCFVEDIVLLEANTIQFLLFLIIFLIIGGLRDTFCCSFLYNKNHLNTLYLWLKKQWTRRTTSSGKRHKSEEINEKIVVYSKGGKQKINKIYNHAHKCNAKVKLKKKTQEKIIHS